MSFGGQFGADAEMERRLQEEFRRRQALRGGGMAGQQQAAPFNAVRPNDYSRLGMLGEQSPYYQRSQHAAQHPHASPYARATHPYNGLAEPQRQQQQAANPYGQVQVHSGGQDQPPMGRLYAEQQLRQQQAVQQAVQANYAAAYGQQADPRYSFGPTAPVSSSPYSRDAYSGQAQKAQELAMIQQQQREREHVALLSAQKKKQQQQKQQQQHAQKQAPQYLAKSPVTVRSPGAKLRKKTQKLTAVAKRKESAPRRKQMGSKIQDEDTNQQWYTGTVPLGLDDDKYWLSELQVYLRANFAEAFGATEEDIAAPMHGRNKPIALGQVGIRCMHCKRTY